MYRHHGLNLPKTIKEVTMTGQGETTQQCQGTPKGICWNDQGETTKNLQALPQEDHHQTMMMIRIHEETITRNAITASRTQDPWVNHQAGNQVQYLLPTVQPHHQIQNEDHRRHRHPETQDRTRKRKNRNDPTNPSQISNS